MKTSAIICPICGRSSDEVRFIDAFCVDDYPVDIRMPSRIDLQQCKRCLRVLLKGIWVPYNQNKISGYVLSKVKGTYDTANIDFTRGAAVFEIKRGEKVFTIERPAPFRIITGMCPEDNRISGGYFQAIIQLRGERKKVEKFATMFFKDLSDRTYISKTEEKDEGLDLYVGSSKAVLSLMIKNGFKTLITKKLVGRSEGKRLYQTTFLLRL